MYQYLNSSDLKYTKDQIKKIKRAMHESSEKFGEPLKSAEIDVLNN